MMMRFPYFLHDHTNIKQEFEKLQNGGNAKTKKTGNGSLTDSTKLVAIAAIASIIGIMVGKNMSK